MNQPPNPTRRWPSFSLRTLLIIVTLAACAIVGKLQWDHHQQLKRAALWVDGCTQELLNKSQRFNINSTWFEFSTA